MASSLTEEKTYYLRLVALTIGIAPKAVRSYFNSVFPPLSLATELKKNEKKLKYLKIPKKILTSAQWMKLFPTGMSSTYIRWGRSDCSGVNTEIVFSGYAAGEKYFWGSNYRGGASNMLCLPNNPELSDKGGSGSSFIFGTEFQGNEFAPDSNNEDVPCVLCRSSNTASSVMIPGRKSCYAGWKKEYNGILAASAKSHTPSPYICVDINPTYVKGGTRNNDEHLLYVTAMKCGSLPCPPYKDNVQVNCVVCSK